VEKGGIQEGKSTVFSLMLSRFNEFRGSIDFENIEEEFAYSKDYVGLSK